MGKTRKKYICIFLFVVILFGAIFILVHKNHLSARVYENRQNDTSDSSEDNGNHDRDNNKQNNLPISDEDVTGGEFSALEVDTESVMEKGTVKVSKFLYQALMKSDSPSEVFSVYVIEKTGAAKQDIYDSFISKAGVEENFLQNRFIYVTREQIEELVCPKDMAFVLYHEAEESNHIRVDKRTIDIFDEESLNVIVYVNDQAAVNKALEEIKELENTMSPEEYQEKRISAIAEAVDSVVDPLIKEYNISEDELIAKGGLLGYFRAKLPKEKIREMLGDKRLAIWKEKGEGVLSDFAIYD